MNDMERQENPLAIVAKYQGTPPIDLDAIARDLGLTIFRINLGDEISGQIIRDPRKGGKSGFAIYVNSSHHPNRQRFTLAHEISHFILHRDLIENGVIDDTMYRSQELNSYYESQANRMAADILMPIRLVKTFMPRYPRVEDLARVFGVSKGAMEIRLKSIGNQSGQTSLPV